MLNLRSVSPTIIVQVCLKIACYLISCPYIPWFISFPYYIPTKYQSYFIPYPTPWNSAAMTMKIGYNDLNVLLRYIAIYCNILRYPILYPKQTLFDGFRHGVFSTLQMRWWSIFFRAEFGGGSITRYPKLHSQITSNNPNLFIVSHKKYDYISQR